MPNISEIFSSIQGEGKYVGVRQLFMRFIGCNMNCPYCDTEELAHGDVHTPCSIEANSLSEQETRLVNPVTWEDLQPYLQRMLTTPHHSISLTGGEPLLYVADIIQFAQLLRRGFFGKNLPLFLESNGTLPQKLEQIINYLDIISMDIKLPSDAGGEYWKEHRQFLEIATQRDVYVKILVSATSTEEEFLHALDLISSVDSTILCVLQPLTSMGGKQAPSPQKMLLWQDMAANQLDHVRVIPQTHKMMHQL